jgi:hypothetical protein
METEGWFDAKILGTLTKFKIPKFPVIREKFPDTRLKIPCSVA